ncbi:hypothetical protein BH09BAC6_BH09BAC6_27110 [soil metagenome]|jgi:hypothetical protein
MLKTVNRKSFLKAYPDFPQSNNYRNTYTYPGIYNSYILYTDAVSTRGLCNNVATALTKLMKLLNYRQLSFLGDSTIPWLYRDHDYKPVKRGLDFLVQNKVSKTFAGALTVDVENLPGFAKHLFWLVRCNGVVFTPYFCDEGFNIIANVCKYGNIHFDTLNEQADLAFNKAIGQTGLVISTDNNCYTGKIPGRTIVV